MADQVGRLHPGDYFSAWRPSLYRAPVGISPQKAWEGEMARSGDDDLWALAHAERTALAENLSGLTAEQWRHSTLCGQWDVEEVVAHLTAAASLNQWRWVRSMLGARFRVDTHNQRRMVEHRGSTPAETLDRFRAILDSTTAPSGHTPAYLGEVVVHAQDIRQPLGMPQTPDVDALTPVAAFFARAQFHGCQSDCRCRSAAARRRWAVCHGHRTAGHRIDPRSGDEYGWPRSLRGPSRRSGRIHSAGTPPRHRDVNGFRYVSWARERMRRIRRQAGS